MTDLTPIPHEQLPALIQRAADALLAAKTSGEVLEARDAARVAYDAAKSAGRMARAKEAHDTVLGKVYRAQADALLIEARAKARLADEYDAAQERGEVQPRGGNRWLDVGDDNTKPATAADLGLRRDEIHEARQIRDAEKVEPGLAERAVNAMVERGEEPTKTELRRSIMEAVKDTQRRPTNKNPHHRPDALRDAVISFAGHCQRLAETENVEALAQWRGNEHTPKQARAGAAAAKAVLQRFIDQWDWADAQK